MHELKQRLHARDRHAQHAAGRARRRDDRVLQPRGRRTTAAATASSSSTTRPRRSSPSPPTSAPRATSPAGSDERSSFHEELEQLEAALQEEGALVLRVLRSALNALARGDDELADEVIGFDDEIDRRYVADRGGRAVAARAADAGRDRPPARARGAARQPPPRADGRLLRDGREADEADGRPRRERRARSSARSRTWASAPSR